MAEAIETGASGKLNRRAVVRALLKGRENAPGGGLLVIGGLGAPAWDITAAGDCPENLPLWGGMGGAAMMGLGLAVAQPARRVLAITGDGELLMGLGSLATIAAEAPGNLAILVIDNERYGETGMQPSHTANSVMIPRGVTRATEPGIWKVTGSNAPSTVNQTLPSDVAVTKCGAEVVGSL